MDPQSGDWVVACTEIAALTAAFVMFGVYKNFRTSRLSCEMVKIRRKLSLRQILSRDWIEEAFDDMLRLSEKTDFELLSQRPGFCRMRLDELDLFGCEDCAGWFYYYLFTWMCILERKFETMGESPRPVRTVHYRRGSILDVLVPG